MRLFKKRSFDTGPQLLSASPLSDETRTMIFNRQLNTPTRAENSSAFTTPKRPTSTFGMPKSISSLSSMVGKKWDEIKRSNTSDLSGVLKERKRQPSLGKKNFGDDLNFAQTSTPVSAPFKTPSSSKRSRPIKSLQNLFKSFSWSGRGENIDEASFNTHIRFEAPVPTMEKSLSESALKVQSKFEELTQKKSILARQVQDLERRNRTLEYYLSNPDILGTNTGFSGAKMTLKEINAALKVHKNCKLSQSTLKLQNRISFGSDELSTDGSSATGSYDSMDEIVNDRCKFTEFIRIGKMTGDESGYDTDSTRAGAISPDSQLSTSPKLDDLTGYEGVDLSFCCLAQEDEEPTLVEEEETTLVPQEEKPTLVEEHDDTLVVSDEEKEVETDTFENKSCEVIGALTKDGRAISAVEMKFEEKLRSTGMLKFQIQRRSGLSENSRRAISLHASNLHTIELEKGSQRLGFTIVGGTDSVKGKMGIYVKSILAGGQAAEKGDLRVKDEILAVNGKSLEEMTHGAALLMIKKARRGKLVLYIRRRGL